MNIGGREGAGSDINPDSMNRWHQRLPNLCWKIGATSALQCQQSWDCYLGRLGFGKKRTRRTDKANDCSLDDVRLSVNETLRLEAARMDNQVNTLTRKLNNQASVIREHTVIIKQLVDLVLATGVLGGAR